MFFLSINVMWFDYKKQEAHRHYNVNDGKGNNNHKGF
jgi:hypothetical protein